MHASGLGILSFVHYTLNLSVYLLSVIPFELFLYIFNKKMEISLENKLLEAISQEDLDTVSLLLSKGANPNKTASNGRTCLGQAAYLGYTDIAKKLIAGSCSGNIKPWLSNQLDDTNTEVGCDQASLASQVKLVKQGTDTNTRCRTHLESWTPTSPQTDLEWDEEIGNVAATTSEDEAVTSMYKWYATILENTGAAIVAASDYTLGIDQEDAFGRVALNYAADGDHTEIVKALTEAGCKVDIVGSNGWTPLHTAVACNQLDIAKILVEAGSNVNCRTPIKTTSLHIAACHNVELITLMANNGAILDLRDEKDRTALFIAAAQGHTAIVKFLIERGANFNIEDIEGHTALCRAVYSNHFDTVELLLEAGARITHYKCLLNAALKHEAYPMVVLLAKRGCGINVHNDSGETPLLLAMTLDEPYPFAKILLENGANANACNSQTGANALHLAVEFCEDRDEFEKILNLLMDYSIDLDVRASTRDTALNRAVLMHKDRIAMQLVRYGADVNLCEVLVNVFGNLIIASNRKGLKLANILVKAGHKKVTINLIENPKKTAKWITETFKSPLNLTDICRIRVRQLHKDTLNLRDYVALLPIPDIMKSFLMMEELNV